MREIVYGKFVEKRSRREVQLHSFEVYAQGGNEISHFDSIREHEFRSECFRTPPNTRPTIPANFPSKVARSFEIRGRMKSAISIRAGKIPMFSNGFEHVAFDRESFAKGSVKPTPPFVFFSQSSRRGNFYFDR